MNLFKSAVLAAECAVMRLFETKYFHTRLHDSLCTYLNIRGHHLQGLLCMVGMW
jgi:hypothetical protein